MKMDKDSVKLTRRGLLAGMGTVGLGASDAPASVLATADETTPPVAMAKPTSDDMARLHGEAIQVLRRMQWQLNALVADTLQRSVGADLTADEALILFDIASANGKDRFPLFPFADSADKEIYMQQLASLKERGFVSVRPVKEWPRYKISLRKKGREVVALITEQCVNRHGLSMSCMLNENCLPETVRGLRQLNGFWREVVLYRL